jgi:hypothetical protein
MGSIMYSAAKKSVTSFRVAQGNARKKKCRGDL